MKKLLRHAEGMVDRTTTSASSNSLMFVEHGGGSMGGRFCSLRATSCAFNGGGTVFDVCVVGCSNLGAQMYWTMSPNWALVKCVLSLAMHCIRRCCIADWQL